MVVWIEKILEKMFNSYKSNNNVNQGLKN